MPFWKSTDEGRGISAEKMSQISSVGAAGVGLRGIRERIKDFGGDLDVVSNGSKGTTVAHGDSLSSAPSQSSRAASSRGGGLLRTRC